MVARSFVRSSVGSPTRSLARGKFRFTLRDRHYSTQPATTFYSLQHAANLCFPLSSSAEINARRAPKLFVRHPPRVCSRTHTGSLVHARATSSAPPNFSRSRLPSTCPYLFLPSAFPPPSLSLLPPSVFPVLLTSPRDRSPLYRRRD